MFYRTYIVLLAGVFITSPLFSQQKDSIDMFSKARENMIVKQLIRRGIKSERVLSAMRKVPRHEFVAEGSEQDAYTDEPLPIGMEQTISQPYIVAYMTEKLDLVGHEKVLEIGTGSGYQAAVLSLLADSVFTIEIIPELAEQAEEQLQNSGYENVYCRTGDGFLGWPKHAPFDAIIVTAAAVRIPQKLVAQLKEGGRMILPVGRFSQELILIRKEKAEIKETKLIPVRFVPMTGEILKN